ENQSLKKMRGGTVPGLPRRCLFGCPRRSVPVRRDELAAERQPRRGQPLRADALDDRRTLDGWRRIDRDAARHAAAGAAAAGAARTAAAAGASHTARTAATGTSRGEQPRLHIQTMRDELVA